MIYEALEPHYNYSPIEIEYWAAQMHKAQLYAATAAVLGDCPFSIYASKETLLHAMVKNCDIRIIPNGITANFRTLYENLEDGAVVIQFRHGDSDWTKGSAEIVTHASRLGYVNILGYVILTPKKQEQAESVESPTPTMTTERFATITNDWHPSIQAVWAQAVGRVKR